MHHAIGENLPLAIGIAISPIPIIASILMLLSPRARRTSLAFGLGWLVGVTLSVVAFTLLAGVLPERHADGSRPAFAALQVVLGVALLTLCVRRWRSRPREGEEAKLPAWMAAIDAMGTPKALGLGFLLAAANAKNLMLSLSAGATFGHADLAAGTTAAAIAIFVAIAVSTVAIPVIAYQLAPQRIGARLGSVRSWLVTHNAAIMSVLLLVLGAHVLGKGIAGF